MKSAPRPHTTLHILAGDFDPTRPTLADLARGVDITPAVTDVEFESEPYTAEDFDLREVDEWNAALVVPVGARTTIFTGSVTISQPKPRWWEWRKRREQKQAHAATHAIINAMVVPRG